MNSWSRKIIVCLCVGAVLSGVACKNPAHEEQARTTDPKSWKGPTLALGDAEELRWHTRGTLRKEGELYSIDLPAEILFVQSRYGAALAQRAAVSCDGCSEAEEKEQRELLESLLGKTVEINGRVRPRWSKSEENQTYAPFRVSLSPEKGGIEDLGK
ncbi:MAG TPA: hypothetical protein VLC09_13920 [Polyangiaceae bacterium]|nr:hypothetical protein [Polyangiaceae bacterium]